MKQVRELLADGHELTDETSTVTLLRDALEEKQRLMEEAQAAAECMQRERDELQSQLNQTSEEFVKM